jgi:hypothetical protein
MIYFQFFVSPTVQKTPTQTYTTHSQMPQNVTIGKINKKYNVSSSTVPKKLFSSSQKQERIKLPLGFNQKRPSFGLIQPISVSRPLIVKHTKVLQPNTTVTSQTNRNPIYKTISTSQQQAFQNEQNKKPVSILIRPVKTAPSSKITPPISVSVSSDKINKKYNVSSSTVPKKLFSSPQRQERIKLPEGFNQKYGISLPSSQQVPLQMVQKPIPVSRPLIKSLVNSKKVLQPNTTVISQITINPIYKTTSISTSQQQPSQQKPKSSIEKIEQTVLTEDTTKPDNISPPPTPSNDTSSIASIISSSITLNPISKTATISTSQQQPSEHEPNAPNDEIEQTVLTESTTTPHIISPPSTPSNHTSPMPLTSVPIDNFTQQETYTEQQLKYNEQSLTLLINLDQSMKILLQQNNKRNQLRDRNIENEYVLKKITTMADVAKLEKDLEVKANRLAAVSIFTSIILIQDKNWFAERLNNSFTYVATVDHVRFTL